MPPADAQLTPWTIDGKKLIRENAPGFRWVTRDEYNEHYANVYGGIGETTPAAPQRGGKTFESRPCQNCGKIMHNPVPNKAYCESGCQKQAEKRRKVGCPSARVLLIIELMTGLR